MGADLTIEISSLKVDGQAFSYNWHRIHGDQKVIFTTDMFDCTRLIGERVNNCLRDTARHPNYLVFLFKGNIIESKDMFLWVSAGVLMASSRKLHSLIYLTLIERLVFSLTPFEFRNIK